MGLFDRSASKASKLRDRTTLLLPSDPGDTLVGAARLYDPAVHSWHGRLVFRNGVLLFGPLPVTPKLEEQADLPPGMAVAYYTGIAVQSHQSRRTDEATQADGDLLAQALADRLGGTVRYTGPPPEPELAASVWSEQALSPDQAIEVVQPYDEGHLEVQDQTENVYSAYGIGGYIGLSYSSPLYYFEKDAPPALGALRSRRLHHWDLSLGRTRKAVASELAVKLGQAALALASRCGGVALDEYGFPIIDPEDLLPR
jgi:hypothetical protein